MTDPSALPPAGWFPDPDGSGRQRYWDGSVWTAHTAESGPPLATAAAPTAIEQPPLAAGSHVNTLWAWLVAILPLVSLIALPLIDYRSYFENSLNPSRSATAVLGQLANPGLLLSQLVGFLSLAATVVFALLDHRALRALGVVRPFHWAWSFLTPVYMIGRAVVLRRRVHRGVAPTWVYFAVYVLVLIVNLAVIGAAIGAVLANFDPSTFGSTGDGSGT